jgi:hypothetical protein
LLHEALWQVRGRKTGGGIRLAAQSSGQRDNYCRPCRAAYKQEHYAANRQRYVEAAIRRKRAVVAERVHYLLDYFETHPCVDCGERDPVVLEFDHLRDKEFGIGTGSEIAIGRASLTRSQSARSFVQTVIDAAPQAGRFRSRGGSSMVEP